MFLDEYKAVVLKKYATFSGRAGRQEFWSFVLVNFLISAVLGLLKLQALSGLYSLLVLIPSLAVGARRLHDTNRSGWWLLISLVPVVGVIVLLVFAAQKGMPGSNQYGPAPEPAMAKPAEPSAPAAPSSPSAPPSAPPVA